MMDMEGIMKNFILSVVLTIVFLAGIVTGLGSYLGLVFQFDGILILIIVVFPLLFQLVLYGPFFIKAFTAPFAAPFGKDKTKETLKGAYHFFKSYGATIWTTGITTVAIHFIILTRWLEDKAGLGPASVFLASVIMYAGLLHLLIVLPYKAILKKQLTSLASAD
jgi:hypothetical protein